MPKVRVTIRFEYEIDEDNMMETHGTELSSLAIKLDRLNLIAGVKAIGELSSHALTEEHVRFEAV